MKGLKIIAVIISAFILLCSCAPINSGNHTASNNQNTEQNNQEVKEIQLLYCSNDTLNPYKTINKTNAEIGLLLYEPLVSCSNEFEPVYRIADSVLIEGPVCTVKLRSIKFSDGSFVTADDVVNSYNLAKSSSQYSPLLYEVKSALAVDSATVVFNLTQNDPYFENLLSFPIIKKGTENLKNEDNLEIVPTGSGKFVFSTSEESLIPNNYYENASHGISKIKLVNAPDSESVEHYVEVGATDIYYTDPKNNNIIRMSGIKTSLNMNNLVFVGINHNRESLAHIELRHAVSSAIDRTAIAKTAFYSNATATTGFFHPDWKVTSGYQSLQLEPNSKIAIENLEKIGYNRLDSDGYRVGNSNRRLSLSILVNSSNASRVKTAELIKKQLATVGIHTTINSVSDERYYSNLSSGNFDLYIGELRLTPNMDISPLVKVGGSSAFGIKASVDTENEASASYLTVLNDYYLGNSAITSLATSLLNYMPIIPLVYRDALIFHSNNIESIGSASMFDIFSSIDKFKVKD